MPSWRERASASSSSRRAREVDEAQLAQVDHDGARLRRKHGFEIGRRAKVQLSDRDHHRPRDMLRHDNVEIGHV